MTVKSVSVSIIGLFFWWISQSISPTYAAVGFEQQINLINQEYTATDSAVPTDNSLGLIHWDGDTFNGDSVYFEAIVKCDGCSGGNDQVIATLYTSGGSAVSNGSISTTSETYTLIRTTNNLLSSLSNDTNYTVRITRDATAGTASIKAARLIVIQSDTAITHTQTHIELGGASTTTNPAYELLPVPKIFKYDAKAYAPTPTVTLEATLRSSDGDGTAYASLSTLSNCSSTVSNSETSVAGTSWGLAASESISLTDGSTYYVCIKSSSGHTASIANAHLILTQSTSVGIAAVETYALMINRYSTISDSTYTTQTFPIQFTYGNNTGARFNYYFESVLNTSADTGYARLYNIDDTEEIVSSEVSTNNTAYTRVRSSEITTMPTSTKILDTQIKNSASNDTAVASSWLITKLYADPTLTFTLEAVAKDITTNGITTSVASEVNKLDFGYLYPSSPTYIAHKLTTTTNTASGYHVTVKMINTLQGNYPANVIEEFPATWDNPQAWTEPTGTTANVNTGWIGANTSDIRVTGWSSGSGKFGPIGTTSRKVMEATGPDAGTSIYVTYAMEINQYQPVDTYMGTIQYSVIPTY